VSTRRLYGDPAERVVDTGDACVMERDAYVGFGVQ
jgi:hypothetical protein